MSTAALEIVLNVLMPQRIHSEEAQRNLPNVRKKILQFNL
jgi:hypothetical protein